MLERPRGRSRSLSARLFVVLALAGCQRSAASHLVKPPKYEPPGQAKCTVQASHTRPLVVEWAAADRASLEARLARGIVAVRAEGCEIEVLRQCTVPGAYDYLGLTRKNEQVVIRDADDLYAKLPIGAAALEAKLARSGQLDVKLALVGMLEAPVGQVAREALTGDCGRATHTIAGVQIGAFQFYSGGTGEIGAGVAVGSAGAGAKSTSSQELLTADGDPARCDVSTTADLRPPEGCGAVLRIELVALGAPTCPAGSAWDGQRCVVSTVHCPPGTDVVGGRCVARADAGCPAGMSFQTGRGCVAHAASGSSAPAAAAPDADPDVAVCQGYCDTALRCKAEEERRALPEGGALARIKRTCQRMCEWGTNDYNRPQIRECVAGGCDGLKRCEQLDADAAGP